MTGSSDQPNGGGAYGATPADAAKAKANKAGRPSNAHRLLAIVDGAEFYRDILSDNTYCDIVEQGVRRTYGIRNGDFRSCLQRMSCTVNNGEAMPKSAIDIVIDTCAAKASVAPKRKVYLRFGAMNNEAWVDLGDETWECIHITAQGWNIVPSGSVPIRFWRPSSFLALPRPVRATDLQGTLEALQDFFFLSDGDMVLLTTILAGALAGRGPLPVTVFTGPPGAIKTSTLRAARRLIDPVRSLHVHKPNSVEDIMVAARSNAVTGFDNVSGLDDDQSDAICGVSTGQGFADRKHYSNDEATDFYVRRLVMLTGIGEVAGRGDLISRAINLAVDQVTAQERWTEETVEEQFSAIAALALGALLEVAVAGLTPAPRPAAGLPRLADFYMWGIAAGRALGWPMTFEQAFADNKQQQAMDAVENSPVLLAIDALFAVGGGPPGQQGILGHMITGQAHTGRALKGAVDFDAHGRMVRWYGRMNELLDDLATVKFGFHTAKQPGWPGGPKYLSTTIKHVTEIMQTALGVRVTNHPKGKHPTVELSK